MNLKVIGMTAALAVASVVSAQAATIPPSTHETATNWTFMDAISNYTSWYNSWISIYSALPAGTWTLSTAIGNIGTTNVVSGQFTSGSTVKSFQYLGAMGGTGSASYDKVAAVSVPGPEAGAGLGALALGGVALYVKRRRKNETLAA